MTGLNLDVGLDDAGGSAGCKSAPANGRDAGRACAAIA